MNKIIIFVVSFLVGVFLIPVFEYLGLGSGFSLKMELVGIFINSALLAIFLEPVANLLGAKNKKN